jgi:hypothetical protein
VYGFYRFDEGHRESIRRIISAAKSMLSRNAISRAGEGLPSSTDSFLHAKMAAMTPRVRLRPSSISFSIGGLRKDLRQRKGTTVYYFFFHMSQNSLTIFGIAVVCRLPTLRISLCTSLRQLDNERFAAWTAINPYPVSP